MIRKSMKAGQWICPLLFLIVLLPGTLSASSNSADILGERSEDVVANGVLNKEIRIFPQLNHLNFGYGQYGNLKYRYLLSINRLFFHDSEADAKIVDIQFEGTSIILELFSPLLGYGTVDFIFETNLSSQLADEDIVLLLLTALGDENRKFVFCNPESNVCCLSSCIDSAPQQNFARLTMAEAEERGYRKCGFCFKSMLYLPALHLEKAIAREWTAWLRGFEVSLDGTGEQIHLQRLGRKVLSGWPLPLLGYDYSFHLVKSPELRAVAIPAGTIVMTSTLLDALENEGEIEAVLAIAIAHIERRHTLKQYWFSIEESERSKMIKQLAMGAGSLAGGVLGGLFGALGSTVFPDLSGKALAVSVYEDDFVAEADMLAALYFDVNQKRRQDLNSVLKKLQFNRLAEHFHPDIEARTAVDIPNRLLTVKDAKFFYPRSGKAFIDPKTLGYPLQLYIVYQSISDRGNRLQIYIQDKSLFKEIDKYKGDKDIALLIQDKNGQHVFHLMEKHNIDDQWGVHMSFSASENGAELLFDQIETVRLKVSILPLATDKQGAPIIEYFNFAADNAAP